MEILNRSTFLIKNKFSFCIALVTLSCSSPAVLQSKKQPSAVPTPGESSVTAPSNVPNVSSSDTGSVTKTEDSVPHIVATLAPLTNQPNIALTAVPLRPDLIDPTLPKSNAPNLQGEWIGLCFWNESGRNPNCNLFQNFVNADKTCPPGYRYTRYGARTKGRNEDWSATCLYDVQRTDHQNANPAQYALAGALYGICYYWHNRSECIDYVWPMRGDKTCPAGFRFVHTAARHDGEDGRWSGACMLNEGSGRPAPLFPSTLSSLCVNRHDGEACTNGTFGPNITSKSVCSQGFTPSHFTARYNGFNELWPSICIKN